MYDLILGTEAGHLLTGKVHSVVIYDGTGEPEVAHYILLEELDNMLSDDFEE